MLAAALVVAGCGADERDGRAPAPLPEPLPAAEPPAPRRATAAGDLAARLLRTTTMRRSPGGARIARVARRTRFGSPTVFAVVGRRGGWLGVLAPEAGNGEVGWIRRDDAELVRTTRSLRIDLSARRVTLLAGRRVLDRIAVAIGRPGSPTPTGRFAVTDLLRLENDGGPYGCCVVALSARQPQLPQGWGGGDRIAIHATPLTATIGQAVSLGCLRAGAADVRRLMRRVPLGARVRIVA